MILNISHVSKIYPQGQSQVVALNDISFQVQRGETWALLGPSGSGKSTLLSLLAGLDHPSLGQIEFEGTNLATLSEAQLTQFRASHIGFVFQRFHLMSQLTALENVSLPLEIRGINEAGALAEQALTQVGLSHRAHHFPAQLSGGECQRVAIARAAVVKPPLLLADEPSGNLDQETGLQVTQLLFDMVSSENMTLILVTHNEELALRCQHQLRLFQETKDIDRQGVHS